MMPTPGHSTTNAELRVILVELDSRVANLEKTVSKIETKIDAIDKTLRGNGEPGLVEKVRLLNDSRTFGKNLIMPAIIAVITAIVVSLLEMAF